MTRSSPELLPLLALSSLLAACGFAAQDPCVGPSCADAATGCPDDGGCGPEGPDDLDCPDDWTPADPNGDGVLECVQEASDCSSPDDCTSAVPCCARSCLEEDEDEFGPGFWRCTPDCPTGPGCASNDECEDRMGLGWTCEQGCPDHCVPPVECGDPGECVLVASACEGGFCAHAVARTEVVEDPCVTIVETYPHGDLPPCECTDDSWLPPGDCRDFMGVACLGGQCVGSME